MKPPAIVWPLLCLALASPGTGRADPAMQEGNWAVTMKMEMVGMPVAMPPVNTNQCVTKKDLVPDMSKGDQGCVVKNQKVNGDTVTWQLQCTGKDGTMEGDGRIQYGTGTYDGDMLLSMSDKSGGAPMQIKYKMHGKHTGPCTADSKTAKRADDY